METQNKEMQLVLIFQLIAATAPGAPLTNATAIPTAMIKVDPSNAVGMDVGRFASTLLKFSKQKVCQSLHLSIVNTCFMPLEKGHNWL